MVTGGERDGDVEHVTVVAYVMYMSSQAYIMHDSRSVARTLESWDYLDTSDWT